MIASLIDNDTKVVLVCEGDEKHIVDLSQLAESDLKKLKIAATNNLFEVAVMRDQIHEFIRRINAVLDTRTNNSACLHLS